MFLVGCDSWFYFPNADVYSVPEDHDVRVEEVSFAAKGGPRLHGWWLEGTGESRGTVVYCHGNHGNLTHHVEFVKWLPRRGFHVLIFDYRGFGKSAGSVERSGTVDDAVAAIDFALQRDAKRVVVFGHSLGGAIGIVAAAQRLAVRAVVAESTFPSYRAAARATAPALSWLVPLLVSAGSDPVDALPEIPPRPLLIVHGAEDDIAPVELAWELYRRAEQPKGIHIVEGASHATPWGAEGAKFEERIVEFFASAIER